MRCLCPSRHTRCAAACGPQAAAAQSRQGRRARRDVGGVTCYSANACCATAAWAAPCRVASAPPPGPPAAACSTHHGGASGSSHGEHIADLAVGNVVGAHAAPLLPVLIAPHHSHDAQRARRAVAAVAHARGGNRVQAHLQAAVRGRACAWHSLRRQERRQERCGQPSLHPPTPQPTHHHQQAGRRGAPSSAPPCPCCSAWCPAAGRPGGAPDLSSAAAGQAGAQRRARLSGAARGACAGRRGAHRRHDTKGLAFVEQHAACVDDQVRDITLRVAAAHSADLQNAALRQGAGEFCAHLCVHSLPPPLSDTPHPAPTAPHHPAPPGTAAARRP